MWRAKDRIGLQVWECVRRMKEVKSGVVGGYYSVEVGGQLGMGWGCDVAVCKDDGRV